MVCPKCGLGILIDPLPDHCPECGYTLNPDIQNEPSAFSFQDTVFNVQCPSCRTVNEIHHGFGYCVNCESEIFLYKNSNGDVMATQHFTPSNQPKFPLKNRKKSPWKTILIIIAALVFLPPIAERISESTEPSSKSTYTPSVTEKSTQNTKSNSKKEISFGDTFTFDNLEITFADDIQWHTLENQFSDHDGADVFSIAIKIKNTGDETHGLNMFYYKTYGSDGTMLDRASGYFDNSVSDAGDMRSGATKETRMYILYNGDGDYYVEFKKSSPQQKVEVKLPVTKP